MAQLAQQPILSIAIPTYQRAKFLNRCLSFLSTQLKDKNYLVEIIVSDNASTDNTSEVVRNHISNGLSVKYIRNTENMGADYNVAQCYVNCTGKYIVAFGDDDVFLNGSIGLLLELLKKNDFGVVFLKHMTYDVSKIHSVDRIDSKIYNSSLCFLNDINIYITFISGNIINSKYFDADDAFKNVGSNVNHVPFIFKAILAAEKNVIITNPVIATEPDNTGGYNLFQTFGTVLMDVLAKAKDVPSKKAKRSIVVINNKFLTLFFPIHILNFKTESNNKFININPKQELLNTFRSYPYFWIFCFPLFYLPSGIGNIYYRGIRKLMSFF